MTLHKDCSPEIARADNCVVIFVLMNENHLDNIHIRWPSGIFVLTPKYFPIVIKGNYTE